MRRIVTVTADTAGTQRPGCWRQRRVRLAPRRRGFHIVTQELLDALPELLEIEVGMAHFFLQHTSASLLLTENADPDVRLDLERHLHELAPENAPYYQHVLEGADDMPGHIKSVLLGVSLSVPVQGGRLQLGTWQGICLGEHREHGGARTVVVTLSGSLRG